MARKLPHGTLCRICGERPRVRYKSGLSSYCRDCANEQQRRRRGGGGAAAPAPRREQPRREPQPVTPEAERVAAMLAAAPTRRITEAIARLYTWR